MKKRIGIDARLYFQTGVGVYIRNFLHHLQLLKLDDLEFIIYVLADESPFINFFSPSFHKKEVKARWHTLSEQLFYLRQLMADKLDLMHFTYFSYPVLYFRPFITTIHDVTPRLLKTGKASTRNPLIFAFKHRIFRLVLSSQVHNSSLIITPTYTVKRQLIQFYGQQIEQKIVPIAEGVDYQFMETEENKNLVVRFQQPFFLYVGNFYPHKNVESLLNITYVLPANWQLVLVGPNNYFSERVKYLINKKKLKNVVLFHNARIEDLKFFYNHAKAFINPSLSEGFGLTLMEAVYCNLPIIASNLEVFREILGDSFLAFNPYDSADIVRKIQQFLDKGFQPDYRNILAKYSFKQMTTKIVEKYKELL